LAAPPGPLKILPSQGAKADPGRRIVITHKVVTSLNEGTDADEF
jgi:hypothetical protein